MLLPDRPFDYPLDKHFEPDVLLDLSNGDVEVSATVKVGFLWRGKYYAEGALFMEVISPDQDT